MEDYVPVNKNSVFRAGKRGVQGSTGQRTYPRLAVQPSVTKCTSGTRAVTPEEFVGKNRRRGGELTSRYSVGLEFVCVP